MGKSSTEIEQIVAGLSTTRAGEITRRASLMRLIGMGLPGAAVLLAAEGTFAATVRDRIRIVCSSSLVGDVNLSDARAAIKSWGIEIARLASVDVQPDDMTLFSPEQLMEMVRKGAVDGFGATTLEYLKMAAYVDPHFLLVDDIYVKSGEEYLILTHDQNAAHALPELRGERLLLFNNAATCLAPNWLDTLLDASNLGPPDRFFKEISSVTKLSRTLLPVYFRQADACMVTRRGFATMCEMNPDLSKKLRTIAASPKVVPICMAFHKGCPQERKVKFAAAMAELPKAPGGKQLLSLFQSHAVSVVDSSILHSADEMVRASERIRIRGARRI